MYEACRLWESARRALQSPERRRNEFFPKQAFVHSPQLTAEQMTLINDATSSMLNPATGSRDFSGKKDSFPYTMLKAYSLFFFLIEL